MDVENLNNMMIDVLGEIANIGSGNAITALSSMLAKRVDMSVPQVRILEFNEVAAVLGGGRKASGWYLPRFRRRS